MVTLVGYAAWFSVTHGYVCRLRSPVTHGYGSQLCNLVPVMYGYVSRLDNPIPGYVWLRKLAKKCVTERFHGYARNRLRRPLLSTTII